MTAQLRLKDLRDGTVHVFDTPPVRVGRAVGSELLVSGAGAEVVSGSHARLVVREGAWWIEDCGARNGTYVDQQRLPPEQGMALRSGQILGFGERGPRYEVQLVEAAAPATVVEVPLAGPEEATVPLASLQPQQAPQRPRPPAPPAVTVVLRGSGRQRIEGTGGRLRVGRGRECDLRVAETQQAVSRVHCEILLRPEGDVVVRDAQSRNGTLLDGQRIAGEQPLAQGQRLRLGDKGPEFLVERVSVTGVAAAPAATPAVAAPAVPATPRPATPRPAKPGGPPARRSFGGKGRTVFVRELLSETERKHASRVRAIVWTFVVLLAGGVGGMYWLAEQRARATEEELAKQRAVLSAARAAADSVRSAAAAEYQRLAEELEAARAGAAPAAVVDSLRAALDDARTRTASLESALERAREGLNRQLASGDSIRLATQRETERLRAELANVRTTGISQPELDSLRRAVQSAEQRAATIEAGLRAVRGADLARIAQANQAAVGLVSAFVGQDIYDGSGFVITASGYFVTNRHVVEPGGKRADSVHVTLADQRTGHRTVIVAVEAPAGPDLAVLHIPRYVGPYVARGDWDGTRARQGEPAALIGFPAGVAAALDNTRTVRTSMSAGIFSKVTPTLIQFDGFTVGGSSGSPIFNANGEVVAVHAQGLREAAGLGFAVPVRLVLPLLPENVRRELTR